jgi:hypothetical protein
VEKYRKVVVLENEVEAALIEKILIERKIPHLIRSYRDSAYNGLFQAQTGWGHVETTDEYRDEVEEIYGDLSTNIVEDDIPESEQPDE